uniref:Uncharacterized protein n=1 Tax=Arundo donax TaxID=35708 RepID=A0A0A9FUW5_ARUDO
MGNPVRVFISLGDAPIHPVLAACGFDLI